MVVYIIIFHSAEVQLSKHAACNDSSMLPGVKNSVGVIVTLFTLPFLARDSIIA